jgi:NTP pyrophosphatase (non-canonical NTP hydrolase)
MTGILDELTERLVAFREARDWRRFHGLKNLMLSLNLEAAELLELGQWKDDAEVEAAAADPAFRARLAEECADVLLYLLLICERAGVDLAAAAADKIERNAAKYPVERARGNARKYTEL